MKTMLTAAQIATHTIDCDADPFIPEGWTVESHKRGGQIVWDPSKVRLYLSEEQTGNKYVEGNELRKDLKDQPVLNANILDYLLDHPDLVPEEWKNKCVFFWGTIYRDRDGSLCVRYLCWHGASWSWYDFWLDFDWGSDHPAAVLAS